MEERYLNLINAFKKLDVEDKKEEIIKNSFELLKLLYFVNKKIDNYNDILPVLNNYNNEDEYFDLLFTHIISLKEDSAKLIEKLEN